MATESTKKGKEKLKNRKNVTHRFEEVSYLRFKRVCAVKGVNPTAVLQQLYTKWAEKIEKEIRTGGVDEIFQLVQND